MRSADIFSRHCSFAIIALNRTFAEDRWTKKRGVCYYLNGTGSKRLQSDCINNIKLLNLKYVIKHCVFELSEWESNNSRVKNSWNQKEISWSDFRLRITIWMFESNLSSDWFLHTTTTASGLVNTIFLTENDHLDNKNASHPYKLKYTVWS